MSDRVFLDTNLLVYLYTADEPQKQFSSHLLLTNQNCCISVQTLNEFCNVCLKKLKLTHKEIYVALAELKSATTLFSISYHTLHQALSLHERYKYSYYDCVMLASALQHNCNIFYTEDLAHGQVIDGRLTITNPFA
ncbi:MAG: PIN domain-containing protein [Oscillospiraceae bacterium]|nr:PIN domain-containing protein [Oscillospiraceae bacterium]